MGDKFLSAPGLTLIFTLLLIYFMLTQVFTGILSTLLGACCKKNNRVQESHKSIKEEGNFSDIKETLKFKGQAAYDLRDNPKYKSIILLLQRKKLRTHVDLGTSAMQEHIPKPEANGLKNSISLQNSLEESLTFTRNSSIMRGMQSKMPPIPRDNGGKLTKNVKQLKGTIEGIDLSSSNLLAGNRKVNIRRNSHF